MKKPTRTKRVKREDHHRALLTEVCPYEVPVIFDNYGFYLQIKAYNTNYSDYPDLVHYLFFDKDKKNYCIPFTYSIRKDFSSSRTLSLMHPKAQLNFVEIYKNYGGQILLACQKSKFSIRLPRKVASKYYLKNPNENIKKYRSDTVSLSKMDTEDRYITSYFSYGGHTRLHKFFESFDFLNLEARYSSFWALDISKCFDSIYTHSITWALKNKDYSKQNSNIQNTFESIFDRAMQLSNYNETAGILIGPEVSRIFSEVIFQKIDSNIESELSELGLQANRNYAIRRYVDDYFIFSDSESNSKVIADTIEKHCKLYKFNLNTSKTIKTTRPFITQKTKSLRSVKKSLKELETAITPQQQGSSPKELPNSKRLLINLVDDIKSACSDDPEAYDLVSGYLISWFSNKIISTTEDGIDKTFTTTASLVGYTYFYIFMIRCLFHFYNINPTHRGSVKICTAIKLACMFFEKHNPQELNLVKSTAYSLCKDFFCSSTYLTLAEKKGKVCLEALNILVLLRELGENYRLPREILSEVANFSSTTSLSYFEIIALLYYIGDSNLYNPIKKRIIQSIKEKLNDLRDIKECSEKLHLLLDVLACPYLNEELRGGLIKRLYKQTHRKEPTEDQLNLLIKQFANSTWFVKWKDFDLITVLEKKELLSGY
jgi:hypothetical protein